MADDRQCEFFKDARQEILFRVGQRDNYLKLHLLCQGAILALSGGVELGEVKASGPIPEVLVLAVPLALIFASLFYNENLLVAQLSRYVTNLMPASWDGSEQLKTFGKESTAFRLVVQVTSFAIIPAGLFGTYVARSPSAHWASYWWWPTILVEATLFLALLAVVLKYANYLREWGKKEPAPAPAGPSGENQAATPSG